MGKTRFGEPQIMAVLRQGEDWVGSSRQRLLSQ